MEQFLQDMVPELDELNRKGLFNPDEIREIVKRRREFEYMVKKVPGKPQDYLNYIRYEVALECLRQRRVKQLRWKKRTLTDNSGIRRLLDIFDRGTRRFKGDVRFWYQHIDFCLRSGSTKVLSRVVMRAVKLHPKEVSLWLLAADRELKLGQIQGARTLLMRGLRFSPRSAKLWAEFLRMEFQVAQNFESLARAKAEKLDDGISSKAEADVTNVPEVSADNSDTSEKKNPWKPAALLLKRALDKLSKYPRATLDFLTQAAAYIAEQRGDGLQVEGHKELKAQLQEAISEKRPGIPNGPEWQDVPADVVKGCWELWWTHERKINEDWRPIGEAVASHAPPAAVVRFVNVLANSGAVGEPKAALILLAQSIRVASESEAAVAVLEALERSGDVSGNDAGAKAFRSLLQDAAARHPWHALLQRVALQILPAADRPPCAADAATIVRDARDISSADSVLLLVSLGGQVDEGTVETLLRALAPGESAQQLVQAYVAHVLSHKNGDICTACTCLHRITTRLWDKPAVRSSVLTAVLDVEMIACFNSQLQLQECCDHFEEVLSSLSDGSKEKIDWWVRYMDFAHTATKNGPCRGVPSPNDIHWRAMRSVADQTRYLEKVHKFLQVGSL